MAGVWCAERWAVPVAGVAGGKEVLRKIFSGLRSAGFLVQRLGFISWTNSFQPHHYLPSAPSHRAGSLSFRNGDVCVGTNTLMDVSNK